MRELALHILDLVENSIRANSSVIEVTVAADQTADRLRIQIDDNGPGLKVTPQQALDPFYTTKSGKRTGLGLSLFKAAAERAGGRLTLERSDLGGLRVLAEMGLRHVDRSPLGDLATSLGSVVCANPHIDFHFRISHDGHETCIRTWELAHELGLPPDDSIALARRVIETIRTELETARGLA
ncbi:MAG: ATP-binding protein [Phycisphaerae bacterium]|jgi:signal transduction histidine kinase|nr:ATP-binding protein [Phycisphaerae bacterium]HPC22778.1 ATP-binding protein [Phycisphaerae bacterium]HRS27118.1 ATP-binding protein [Phycisphaerae bacterium]HRT40727.1 ATP-binding protein [Phycisphaerae bacterium]